MGFQAAAVTDQVGVGEGEDVEPIEEEELGSSESEGDGEGKAAAAEPARPKLSPWEAAVLAFQREQKMLSKVRPLRSIYIAAIV